MTTGLGLHLDIFRLQSRLSLSAPVFKNTAHEWMTVSCSYELISTSSYWKTLQKVIIGGCHSFRVTAFKFCFLVFMEPSFLQLKMTESSNSYVRQVTTDILVEELTRTFTWMKFLLVFGLTLDCIRGSDFHWVARFYLTTCYRYAKLTTCVHILVNYEEAYDLFRIGRFGSEWSKIRR